LDFAIVAGTRRKRIFISKNILFFEIEARYFPYGKLLTVR
jgi:hypothetical protein